MLLEQVLGGGPVANIGIPGCCVCRKLDSEVLRVFQRSLKRHLGKRAKWRIAY